VKIDARSLIAPLVGVLIFALTFRQITSAVRASGMWQPKPHTSRTKKEDPYARLERALTRPLSETTVPRDPFSFGTGRAPVAVAHPIQHTPTPPPPAPKPTLTSIIWDNDPRATIRYDNRDFSVRENSLFAEFTVKSITSTQVVLERNGEELVLTLRSKGD